MTPDTDDTAASPLGRVRLNIQRLTLPWLSLSDQSEFTRCLREEIQALALRHGLDPTKLASAPHLDRVEIRESDAGAAPGKIARRIAERLFENLLRQAGPSSHV